MRRLLVVLALAIAVLALPAAVLAATKPIPVTLAGMLFNNKPNVKVKIKLGGSLRFTWKDGFHNVLTRRRPPEANKVNSGAPTPSHKPITFKPTKKGKYIVLLPAPQGARHGAHLDRHVTRSAPPAPSPAVAAVGRDEQLAVGGDRVPDAVVAGIGCDERGARAARVPRRAVVVRP